MAASTRSLIGPSTRSATLHSGRVAFSSAPARVCYRQQARLQSVRTMAGASQYPDAEYISAVLEAFPDQGLANAEEARALFSNGGYTYLDVRAALECQDIGKVRDSVNIPWVICKWVYNAEKREKNVVKEDNPDFLKQVEKRFPNKDTKLMIACNTGKAYSMKALIALDEAGYTNLVGLKGGYNAWNRLWDNKLGRRRYGEYAENATAGEGDSCGIHASGAGFDRSDKVDKYTPQSIY
eukprot:CAMPEP_0119103788 /NCGR_PEP_ID=MMETSP1180-20130426/2158_1 /TAXON_ID=3052 ORGANISM="Chlamydomonas cf sp, Strain CCMP681" /NCGR_SAMPLE_ID=MMETSP1180 /ASSEMBLY_ACC=CAM_ASM_000741 /LENGTH=237 /DNA_ID=CAMNT_0007088379 /DNA_START=38 /DNA_END=751 /DNA_ORIENTATION=-